MLPSECPDGLDCPWYYQCQDDPNLYDDDQCPLAEHYYDHNVPLDKIIKGA